MSFQDLEQGEFAQSGTSNASAANRQDPSQAIAAGIFQINTLVSAYKRYINSLGTPKDTVELRDKLHKTRQQIGQLAKDVSAKLKAASERDQLTEVSTSKRIGDAKLAKDFQAVLKEFQKAQRTEAEKETSFTPFSPQTVPSTQQGVNDTKVVQDDHQEKQALLAQQRRQENFQLVLQLENEIVFNEAIIEERELGIKEIQQQIGEVNEIFKDLAVLVHEQGVMIDDIDSHVESAYAATTQGKVQLAKAAKGQKSQSSLKCWLLGIFGLVILIGLIVFLVVRL